MKSETMAWYSKYLSIYDKPLSEVPQETIDYVSRRLRGKQSKKPMVSAVVIAHNEARRLPACLWSLSEIASMFPLEIIGVNNGSTDETEEVFKTFGLTYYNEERTSPGFARQCGLDHTIGQYHFFIDADTLYPPLYINIMMKKLMWARTACVGTFWSYYPDENHSQRALRRYELIRDTFLYLQHFMRPELCIRGMTFACKAELARQVGIRTDIRRGEDGSLALALKEYGNIEFVYNSKARPVTGYGTLGNGSLYDSFIQRAKVQLKGIGRIFYKKKHYEDSEENLIKQ